MEEKEQKTPICINVGNTISNFASKANALVFCKSLLLSRRFKKAEKLLCSSASEAESTARTFRQNGAEPVFSFSIPKMPKKAFNPPR